MKLSPEEQKLLDRAAALAQGGWGMVHPNPMVGCVVVSGGQVVGAAYHQEFGNAHAEVLALQAAGDRAKGSTVYVSLEPCAHQGKTPPCTQVLLEAGVSRVVYGGADPGSESGGGGELLREAGLDVAGPCFSDERSTRDNRAFFHAARSKTPYVALKLAVSLDGRIAAAPGVRTTLSGGASRVKVHGLRAGFDAVMVGAGTARVDDPLLTVREEVPVRVPPARVILDSSASLRPDSALVRSLEDARLVVVTAEATGDNANSLRALGVEVVAVERGSRGLEVGSVLEALSGLGLRSVLCEGGGQVAGSFLRAGALQRIHLFVAPLVLGADGVPAFSGEGLSGDHGWGLAFPPEVLDDDVHLIYDRTTVPPEPVEGD